MDEMAQSRKLTADTLRVFAGTLEAQATLLTGQAAAMRVAADGFDREPAPEPAEPLAAEQQRVGAIRGDETTGWDADGCSPEMAAWLGGFADRFRGSRFFPAVVNEAASRSMLLDADAAGWVAAEIMQRETDARRERALVADEQRGVQPACGARDESSPLGSEAPTCTLEPHPVGTPHSWEAMITFDCSCGAKTMQREGHALNCPYRSGAPVAS